MLQGIAAIVLDALSITQKLLIFNIKHIFQTFLTLHQFNIQDMCLMYKYFFLYDASSNVVTIPYNIVV